MRYPITLTKDDNDTYLVRFPDVPDAITYGETEAEALAHALDALLTVFDAYMKDRRDIPAPSVRKGPSIELPTLESAKVELYRAMREANVGKYELAKRLNWHLPQVDRVLKVRHGSQIQQMEAAFSAVGKKLDLVVTDRPERGEHPMPGAIIMEQRRHAHAAPRAARSSAIKRAAKKR